MSQDKRRLLERLLGRVKAAPVRDFTPPPVEVAPGLWTLERKITLVGPHLGTRSTLVALEEGLWVHSPFLLDGATRDVLANLPPVAHLVAPNTFHYLYLGDWVNAFPDARVWLAPGLRARCPEVPAGEELMDDAVPAWKDVLDVAVYGPARGVSEAVFLHRPSRTLILTDLVFHLRRTDRAFERWIWRLSGEWECFGPSRTARRFLLVDPGLVRSILERILSWDFDRVIMAHGEILETGGPEAMRSAFASWLSRGA